MQDGDRSWGNPFRRTSGICTEKTNRLQRRLKPTTSVRFIRPRSAFQERYVLCFAIDSMIRCPIRLSRVRHNLREQETSPQPARHRPPHIQEIHRSIVLSHSSAVRSCTIEQAPAISSPLQSDPAQTRGIQRCPNRLQH